MDERLTYEDREVLRVLHEAAPFATTAAEIQRCAMDGCTPQDSTSRWARKIVKRLNRLGYPVISAQDGFHLAVSQEQVDAYRRRLIGRARAILERVELVDRIRLHEAAGAPVGGAA